MANPFSKLVNPRYPSTAVGLEEGFASLVDLERGRGGVVRLRRAASLNLDESLIRPGFADDNLRNSGELAAALNELAASAGLSKQKRWSVALPDETVRTALLTLETTPSSNNELEEILTWKIERTFGIPLDELSTSREKLRPDSQGRARFLIVAARNAVLSQYEATFRALGWRAGLLLPRHLGEAQWLTGNGLQGDSLLLSSSPNGFTAMVFRGREPIILRTVSCETQDSEDEFYRLLLFYRDRRTADGPPALARLLVLGEGFSKTRAAEIANETLETDLRPLDANDLGLELPTNEISFDSIAAPAGLAKLSLN